MWTTDREMNMKAIFEVTNTTLAVVKKKTWKKFRSVQDLNLSPCNTGAVFY